MLFIGLVLIFLAAIGLFFLIRPDWYFSPIKIELGSLGCRYYVYFRSSPGIDSYWSHIGTDYETLEEATNFAKNYLREHLHYVSKKDL